MITLRSSRRSFLFGLGAILAAPAVIRTAGLLMPVRSWREGRLIFTNASAKTITIPHDGRGMMIDGIEVEAGTTWLVRGQSDPADNGIYIVKQGPWTQDRGESA